MYSPSLDNNLQNLDDVNEVIIRSWHQKPKREVSGDELVGINQWLLDGAPSTEHGESEEVPIRKDDNTVSEADLHLAERPAYNRDTIQTDQIAHSSDLPTILPVPNAASSLTSQTTVMTGYTHNQPPSSVRTEPTYDPQVYARNSVIVSTKHIEPLREMQPVQHANLRSAPSQVMYELPRETIVNQTPSWKYAVPSQRSPPNQRMITPNAENLGTQQLQGYPTIVVPSTSSSYYELKSPTDAAELAPGLTCAEYIPSAQPNSYLRSSEPRLVYSIPSSSHAQAAPHPAPAAPVVQDIYPSDSSSYAHAANGHAHPAAGISIVYSAVEKPSSRKRPYSYGTGHNGNISEKKHDKQGGFQQPVPQQYQETRPFLCNICGTSYLTEQDMREHWQKHDPQMKRYEYESYENHQQTVKDRDRHFETHHGTSSHTCMIEGCPKTFARRDDMLVHYKCHEYRLIREREIARWREDMESNLV